MMRNRDVLLGIYDPLDAIFAGGIRRKCGRQENVVPRMNDCLRATTKLHQITKTNHIENPYILSKNMSITASLC